jgi:hypothetical protein
MEIETLQRLRIIALSEMGHSPWLDTSRFQKSEKSKLVNLIQSKYDTLTSDQIVEQFNTLIVEKILLPGPGIEKLPVQIL